MPRSNITAQFAKAMEKLLTQRKKHLAIIAKRSAKVAAIDGMFQKFGVWLEAPKPPAQAAKPAKKAKGRRKRGHFDQTADQYVLGLLQSKPMTTAQLTAAWSRSGRGGRVDNSLTLLTKARKIKREKLKEGKGSQYKLA